MTLLPPNEDYTDRDFDALRARLIDLVQSVFPDWTDFSVASFGNILLEMFAFVGDTTTFYLDAQARESRLATATQRQNVIALARMLGYRLYGAQAATAEVVFQLKATSTADVVIPKKTVIRTPEVTESIRCQLLDEVRIPRGVTEAMGVVENSETHIQRFDAIGQSHLDIILNRVPYLDGSAYVSTAQGIFEERDSLLGSGPNDRHFMVLVDQNDRATLRFGHGLNGLAPSGTVTIRYKTGGGAQGNVEAGSLTVLDGTFHDEQGRVVQISVTNPQPASGGTFRQTIESARQLAPESLRALNRTVTREDFEVNARRVAGVARSLMLTANEDPTIPGNSGLLFIIPKGGGVPTEALKQKVLHQVTVEYPTMIAFEVSVQDPIFEPINIDAEIFLREGATASALRSDIIDRLKNMFRVELDNGTPNPQIDFGFNIKDVHGRPIGELVWSDVFNVIRDTPGVRKLGGLALNGVPTDVRLGAKAFPVLGTVTLLNGDTPGEPL